MGNEGMLFESVQLVCARCGGHCAHISIPVGYRLVSLGRVSRSEADGLTYGRCTMGDCRAWTRFEMVPIDLGFTRPKLPLADAA